VVTHPEASDAGGAWPQYLLVGNCG